MLLFTVWIADADFCCLDAYLLGLCLLCSCYLLVVLFDVLFLLAIVLCLGLIWRVCFNLNCFDALFVCFDL